MIFPPQLTKKVLTEVSSFNEHLLSWNTQVILTEVSPAATTGTDCSQLKGFFSLPLIPHHILNYILQISSDRIKQLFNPLGIILISSAALCDF